MSTIQYGFKSDELVKKQWVAQEDILEIRQWQYSCSYPQLVEEQIALFLLCCDNNLDVTKQTIENYFKMKLAAPEIFANRDMENEDIQRISRVFNVAVMPKRYQDSAIIIVSLKDTDYQNFDVLSYSKLVLMTMDSIQFKDPPKSIISISDNTGYSFMHLTRFKLKMANSIMNYNQYGMPLQIKEMHILKINYVVHAAMNMVKSFLNSAFLEKVTLHRDDVLFDWVPREYLPKEYGGDLQSISIYHEENLKRLRELQPFFKSIDEQVFGKVS